MPSPGNSAAAAILADANLLAAKARLDSQSAETSSLGAAIAQAPSAVFEQAGFDADAELRAIQSSRASTKLG